jgi:hypothetical protein
VGPVPAHAPTAGYSGFSNDTVTRVIDAVTLAAFVAARPGVNRALQRSISTKLRQATRFRVDLGGAPVLTVLAIDPTPHGPRRPVGAR